MVVTLGPATSGSCDAGAAARRTSKHICTRRTPRKNMHLQHKLHAWKYTPRKTMVVFALRCSTTAQRKSRRRSLPTNDKDSKTGTWSTAAVQEPALLFAATQEFHSACSSCQSTRISPTLSDLNLNSHKDFVASLVSV